MKENLLMLFFVVISISISAQDQPIYSMSRERPIIYEPNFELEDTCIDNGINRLQISMYKDVILYDDIIDIDSISFERDTIRNCKTVNNNIGISKNKDVRKNDE